MVALCCCLPSQFPDFSMVSTVNVTTLWTVGNSLRWSLHWCRPTERARSAWTQTLTPFGIRHWDSPKALLFLREHAAKSVSLWVRTLALGPSVPWEPWTEPNTLSPLRAVNRSLVISFCIHISFHTIFPIVTLPMLGCVWALHSRYSIKARRISQTSHQQ